MTSFSHKKCSNSKNKNIRFVRMTGSMFMGNFVETGNWRNWKKLKHVSALACIFVRRDSLFSRRHLEFRSKWSAALNLPEQEDDSDWLWQWIKHWGIRIWQWSRGRVRFRATLVNVFQVTYACILKAHSHSHSMSGGSVWASLECQCCFWIAGGWVVA